MSTNATLHAGTALLPTGWARDVRIDIDAEGWIAGIAADAPPDPAAEHVPIVLPGMPNLHSHAFQRAMAGLAERRSPAGRDDFWTWRETMYRFVGRLTPEDAEAVAAQLYAELLRWGFTAVCEFHYLHHQPDGTPYANRAEMALRHVEAARQAGIGMTMLPCLYRHGGIFGREPHQGQRRFLNDAAGLRAIIDLLPAPGPQFARGVAPHSLRAVTPAMLADITEGATLIHIHAAEQVKEVAECEAATGARPVRWLLDNAPVDPRWCLIHCTHLDAAEVAGLAASGAVAGLCPSTEASLGDGIFPLTAHREAGGRIGIGTDSHVGISVRDELRQLETSQRLRDLARALAGDAESPHPGQALFDAALGGGAQASGRRIGALLAGYRADLLVLDPDHPVLAGREGDALLDSWVFSGQDNPIRHVMCGGCWAVRDAHHVREAAIGAAYRAAVRRLAGN